MIRVFFRKNIIPFLIAVAIGIVLFSASLLSVASTYRVYYKIQIWIIASQFLGFIFPLLSTVPFCWRIFYERKDGFLKYTLNRCSLNKYLLLNFIASSILAFLTVFFVSFAGAVLTLDFITSPNGVSLNNPGFENKLWGDYLINTPEIYAFVLSMWRGILGVIYYSFGFVLSLFYSNIFVITTGPFAYSLLENFAMSIIRLDANSMVTSFLPTRLAPGYTEPYNLLIGPFLLSIITILIFFTECKKRSKEYTRCLNII